MTDPVDELVAPRMALRWTVGITGDVRRFYRQRRREGWSRPDADSMTSGYVLGSRQGHVLVKAIPQEQFDRLARRAGC